MAGACTYLSHASPQRLVNIPIPGMAWHAVTHTDLDALLCTIAFNVLIMLSISEIQINSDVSVLIFL